jgi:hypothetical protein
MKLFGIFFLLNAIKPYGIVTRKFELFKTLTGVDVRAKNDNSGRVQATR